MDKLMTCSQCKYNLDVFYFGLNRQQKQYKTCDNCINKQQRT